MNNKGWIWFDLDGTLYNLYKVPDWLPRLRREDVSVYCEQGFERGSINRIIEACKALKEAGFHIGVISWAGKGVSKKDDFFNLTRTVKMQWVEQYFPVAEQVIVCEYGKEKSLFAVYGDVLVDDSLEVRKNWRRNLGSRAINAKKGYIKELYKICYEVEE